MAYREKTAWLTLVSMAVAYYVLMAGMILVGVVMPFTEPAPKIVNTALLALVIAESVHHVVILISYRRGWHG